MKLKTKTLFAALAAGAIVFTASCKSDSHAGHDHDGHDHPHGEHADHDHDGDDHSGHDHGEDGHDHDHADCITKIGPNGGRILTNTGAEFLITKEGQIQIFFLNEKEEVIAPTVDSLTVLLGATEVELKKEGNVYESVPMKDKLKGKATVQTEKGEDSKTDKFEVSLEKCGDCDNAEYKCTCHKH